MHQSRIDQLSQPKNKIDASTPSKRKIIPPKLPLGTPKVQKYHQTQAFTPRKKANQTMIDQKNKNSEASFSISPKKSFNESKEQPTCSTTDCKSKVGSEADSPCFERTPTKPLSKILKTIFSTDSKSPVSSTTLLPTRESSKMSSSSKKNETAAKSFIFQENGKSNAIYEAQVFNWTPRSVKAIDMHRQYQGFLKDFNRKVLQKLDTFDKYAMPEPDVNEEEVFIRERGDVCNEFGTSAVEIVGVKRKQISKQ